MMEKFNFEEALAGKPILVEYGNLGKRMTAMGHIVRVPNSTSTFVVIAVNKSVVISESQLDYICEHSCFNKSIRNSTGAYPHFSILGMYEEPLVFEYWHLLNDRYNYVAMDEDGTWWAYQNKPTLGKENAWATGLNSELFKLTDRLNLQTLPSCNDWKKSLIKRQITVSIN